MVTLLLVDDDDITLALLPKLLGKSFRVRTSDGAHDALRALDKDRIDVLLTDFELRAENGLWLLAETRDRFPTVRRMLMSGRELRDVERYRLAGLFERFYAKPLAVSQVVSDVYDAVAETGPAAMAVGR